MINQDYTELLSILFEGVYIVDQDRKIIFWNKGCENITGYAKDEVQGKFCHDNILKHVDANGKELCFSGCPLHATLRTGDEMENDVFLHHKEGHRVPVTVRSFPIRDKAGNIVAAVEVFSDNRYRKQVYNENQRLQEMLITDELTNVYNRRYLDYQLKSFVGESEEFGVNFGILFFDIDLFRNVNNTYGHLVGDMVLKIVATTIKQNIRSSDIFGRWGGEEFILIARIENAEKLKRFAEKLRILVSRSTTKLDSGERINVTVSIGGAMFEKNLEINDLIEKADNNMYNAKESGRNRTVVK